MFQPKVEISPQLKWLTEYIIAPKQLPIAFTLIGNNSPQITAKRIKTSILPATTSVAISKNMSHGNHCSVIWAFAIVRKNVPIWLITNVTDKHNSKLLRLYLSIIKGKITETINGNIPIRIVYSLDEKVVEGWNIIELYAVIGKYPDITINKVRMIRLNTDLQFSEFFKTLTADLFFIISNCMF